MQDSSPLISGSTVWVTYGVTGSTVLEYRSWSDFQWNVTSRVIDLPVAPYCGTGHVVHNGFLYYHARNTTSIIKYDLHGNHPSATTQISDVIYTATDDVTELYSANDQFSTSTFVDFHVDGNGLWVVYGNKNTSKMELAMLDLDTLDVVITIELDVDAGSKGNGFITCGKLYMIRHARRRKSVIDVFDIWTGKTKPAKFRFPNAQKRTVMVSFDAKRKRLRTWDAGINNYSGVILHIPLRMAN